jgi:hypothetical protein
MGKEKWLSVWVGGRVVVLLAHMKDMGEVGIIHGNLCEGGYKCGISLVMDLFSFWRCGSEVLYGSLVVSLLGGYIEHCWSQVYVGAGLHSMLDLDWISTRPPLSLGLFPCFFS